MTDDTLTAVTRQAIAAKTASRPKRVTGKLHEACMRIIELGEEDDQAAKAVGLRTRTVRLARQKPHVIAWMKQQREVFRAHVSAQNIFHARKMRNESTNEMAKLGAMKLIEQIGDDPEAARGRVASPGIVILVGGDATAPQPPTVTIEAVPYQPPARQEPPQIEQEPVDVSEEPQDDPGPSYEFVPYRAPSDMRGINDSISKPRPSPGRRGAKRRVADD
jgi:hypothetical protein